MINEQNPGNQNPKPDTSLLDPHGKNQRGEDKTDPIRNAAKAPDKLSIRKRLANWRQQRKEKWKDTAIHDRVNIRLSMVIAISTALYTIFAGWTLYEIHSGSTDTHNLAVAAGNQVTKLDRLVVETQKASRQDQRPWIHITSDDVTPKKSSDLLVRVVLRNAGKTPAKQIAFEAFFEQVNVKEAPKLDAAPSRAFLGMAAGILFPQSDPMVFGRNAYTMKPEELQDFVNGKSYFAIYGTATYKDVFETDHWSRFCYFIVGNKSATPNAKKCTDSNSVDSN